MLKQSAFLAKSQAKDTAEAKETEAGFSLIEILLAVAILSLLAAVAVPKASHVLAVSRTQKVVADLNMLDAALVMYETEKGTQVPNTQLSNLDDYVRNIDNVKPPTGSMIIVKGNEQEVANAEYKIEMVGKQGYRATCDGLTADDILASK